MLNGSGDSRGSHSANLFDPALSAKVFLFRAHGALPNYHETLATIFQGCLALMGSDFVGLTQELLAHMLGTRRASVSVALAFLRKAGLISYVRSKVKISDGAGLEEAARECYASINQHRDRWRSESA